MEFTKKEMRCPLTGCDEWASVDEYRFVPKGMMINKESGFISYPDKFEPDREKIKKHYKETYRKNVGINNLFTGERKIHYHEKFLKPIFEEWKGLGKTKPVIGEVGSAFGMVLNWIKNIYFPEADLVGTEWTTSMKRLAYHEYNLHLADELDESKTYDMIMTYKVLEHQLEPDKELKKYHKLLNDDGLLYIGVPTWFNEVGNFGLSNLFDLEYYYHPDHINVWTRNYFVSLLTASGFKIIEHDTKCYGDTLICVKDDQYDASIEFESTEKVIGYLGKVKSAADAINKNAFEEAVAIWPNIPSVYKVIYESNRKQLDANGLEAITEFLNKAVQNTEGSFECTMMQADVLMRYGRYEDALKVLDTANEIRPNQPSTFEMVGSCYTAIGEKTGEESAFIKARDAYRFLYTKSYERRDSCVNWIYWLNTKIKTDKE